jgi:hypothetical protein
MGGCKYRANTGCICHIGVQYTHIHTLIYIVKTRVYTVMSTKVVGRYCLKELSGSVGGSAGLDQAVNYLIQPDATDLSGLSSCCRRTTSIFYITHFSTHLR